MSDSSRGRNNDWKAKYDAPEGQTWVCGACGKNALNRVDIGDESCFLNAVLCHAKKDLSTGNWKAFEERP